MQRVRPTIPKYAVIAVGRLGQVVAISDPTSNFVTATIVAGMQRWRLRGATIGILVETPRVEYMRAVIRERRTGEPLVLESFSGKAIASLPGQGGVS